MDKEEPIELPNWYQVDFEIKNTHKFTLQLVVKLITLLKDKNLISKWFFLYEKPPECNQAIRLRFCTNNDVELKKEIHRFTEVNDIRICQKHSFDKYKEDKKVFKSEKTVETFANVMYEVSELNINKLQKPSTFDFSNYNLVERISHCIYNNIYGLPAEAYYLLKRLGFKFNNIDREDDPEYTILDDRSELLLVENKDMGFTINIPFKKQNK